MALTVKHILSLYFTLCSLADVEYMLAPSPLAQRSVECKPKALAQEEVIKGIAGIKPNVVGLYCGAPPLTARQPAALQQSYSSLIACLLCLVLSVVLIFF